MVKEFKINNFDLIRIFAATQVLVFHGFEHLGLSVPAWLFVFKSFPGVPMFFAISGFLISASYERNSQIANYSRNRALRIYPALWACIFLTIVTAAIFGGVNFFRREAAPWALSQMVGVIYTPGFLTDYGFGSYNGSLWTIPIELQFYLVLPLLYFVFTSLFKNKKAVDILFLCSLIFFFCVSLLIKLKLPTIGSGSETKIDKLVRYSFVPHFYMFLVGVLMQRLQVYKMNFIHGKGIFWLVGYLCFVYVRPPLPVFLMTADLILAVCTISMAYTLPGIAHKLLKGNDISYGVYIYHGMILNILVENKWTGSYVPFLVLLLLTYFIAFCSWKFIEKPAIRKKNFTIHSLKKRKKPSPAVAS